MPLNLFKRKTATKKPEPTTMTQEELLLNDRIDSMVRASKEDAKDWEAVALDGIDYVYGNQLKRMTIKDGWEPVQCNYVFPALMQQLALLAQQSTTIYANPWEEGDVEGAEVARSILQWYYEVGIKVPELRGDCALDGFLNGQWVLMPYWEERPDGGWNEERNEWEGKVQVSLVPYEYFGAAKDAEKISLNEAEYVYIQRRVYVEWAQQRWPEYADKIKAEAETEGVKVQAEDIDGPLPTGASDYIAQDTTDTAMKDRPQRALAGTNRLAHLLSRQRKEMPGLVPEGEGLETVALLEIYYKDRTTETVEETEPIPPEELDAMGKTYLQPRGAPNPGMRMLKVEDGEDVLLTMGNHPKRAIPPYERPLYPYGRHILRIGDTILNDDEADQRWPYPKWPFIVGPFQKLPHTWRGANGTELIRQLQDWLNVFVMHMLNWVKCHADPLITVEEGTIAGAVDNTSLVEKIKSAAGKIIKLKTGKTGTYRREPPPPMGGGLLELFNLFDQQIRNQLGMQESAQGIASGTRQTASEILRLETNTRLRTALLSKDLDSTTGVELMEWIWILVKKHMSPGDVAKIIGDKGVERLVTMQQNAFDARFDLKVEVGTTLPFDKERRKMEAMQLYQVMGDAFLKRLLEAYEVNNIEELLASKEIASIIEALGELEPELAEYVMGEIEQLMQRAMQIQEAQGGGAPEQQTGEIPAEVPDGQLPPVEQAAFGAAARAEPNLAPVEIS